MNEQLLKEIEKWSNVYQFSFQFWGPGNNNVFICKDGIDLVALGSEENIEAILKETLGWINKQNPGGYKNKPRQRRCGVCGTPIIGERDFCEECKKEVEGL